MIYNYNLQIDTKYLSMLGIKHLCYFVSSTIFNDFFTSYSCIHSNISSSDTAAVPALAHLIFRSLTQDGSTNNEFIANVCCKTTNSNIMIGTKAILIRLTFIATTVSSGVTIEHESKNDVHSL